MAKAPENETIAILQQIQATLAEHTRRFEQIEARSERMQGQMDYRFDIVERKLGELIDSTAKALGSAGIANVRHDSVQQQLAGVELELREVRARLQRLEEKV